MMRFLSNSALNGNGGAMYFSAVPVVQFTPTTMVFESNRAIGTGLGGGMYFSGVRVAQFLPTSMTFQGNIAAVSGGGMYFTNSTVTFGDETKPNGAMSFISNQATGGLGGAMYFTNSSATFTARREMIFRGNIAGQSGGAMYFTSVWGAYFKLAQVMRFSLNSAASGSGGAMYFNSVPIVQFTPSTMIFSANRAIGASGNGGAMALENRSSATFAATYEMSFSSNIGRLGAGIYLSQSYGLFSMGASGVLTFSSNTALQSGGGMYLTGSTMIFAASNMNFTDNKAPLGAVLYAQGGSSVVFKDASVLFARNTSSAAASRGVIGWDNSSVKFENLTNLTARRNEANDGGFLYISNGLFDLDSRDIELSSNVARNSGGAIHLYNSTMSFSNVDMIGNTAQVNGGALYMDGGSSITFRTIGTGRVLISGNKAQRGGGIYGRAGSKIFMFAQDQDITFSSNTALTGMGNDIYLDGGNMIFNANAGRTIWARGGFYAENGAQVSNIGSGTLYLSSNVYFSGVSSFGVIGGGRITIENASFTYESNMQSIYTGAGSTVTFYKSTINFLNNRSMINGGALYADNGAYIELKESDVYFKGNRTDISGGVVYVGANATVSFQRTNMTVEDNYALSSGGFAYVNQVGRLEFRDMERLEFYNNKAGYGGGVFYLGDPNSKLDVFGVKEWIGINNAGRDGGFMYLKQQRFDFEGNGAVVKLTTNTAQGGSGGVFFLIGSTIVFSDMDRLELDYNRAASSGGVIYISEKSRVEFSTFTTLSFEGNKTQTGGGGVFYVDADSDLRFTNIKNLEGRYNEAGSGGFAYFNSQVFTFNDTDIYMTRNSAVSGSGGVFYLNYSTMVFDNVNTLLDYNYAKSSGGAVYIGRGSSLKFKNIETLEFYNNETEVGGGGVFYVNEYSSLTFEGVKKLIGSRNKGGEGGFAYFGYQYFNFKDVKVILTSNAAVRGSGGALYLNGANIVFDGTNADLYYNYAASSGGAIHAQNSSLTFKNIDLLDFENNTAVEGGGVFYIDRTSKFSLSNIKTLQSIHNTAGAGGFIYMDNQSIEFGGMAVNMIENRAVETNDGLGGRGEGNGGALYTRGSTVIFRQDAIKFERNSAQDSGGSVYIKDWTMMSFIDSDIEFKSNEAGAQGGGFFPSNTTGLGGALYLSNNSIISFKSAQKKNKVSFTQNFGQLGGAIYATSGSKVIFDDIETEFSANTSEYEGGAMYISAGSTVIFNKVDIKLSYNISLGSGGAVYMDDMSANELSFIGLSTLEFSYNTADYDGGGIFINEPNSHINFEDIKELKAIYNTAKSGGFGYFKEQDFDFKNINITINYNTAYAGNGGGMYIGAGDFIFKNKLTEFNYNRAIGTASYNYSNGTWENWREGLGGAIYGQGVYLEFSGEASEMSAKNSSVIDGKTRNLRSYDNAGADAENKVRFIGNEAFHGGAIYSTNSVLWFGSGDIVFEKNKSIAALSRQNNGRGGALYLTKTTAVFDGGENGKISFIENTGDYFGAIYIEDSRIEFNNMGLMEFIGNVSLSLSNPYGGVFGSGGGTGLSEIKMDEVGMIRAIENTANRGGFLYLNERIKRADITTIELLRNTATLGDGGAIYIINVSSGVYIGNERTQSDILFIGNKAQRDGGAIFVENSTLTLSAKNSIGATDGGTDILFIDNQSGQGAQSKNDIYISSLAFVSFSVDDNRKIELNSGLMGEQNTKLQKDGRGTLYIGGYIRYLGFSDIKVGVALIDGAKAVEHKAEFGDIWIRGQGKLQVKSLGQEMTRINVRGDAQIDGVLSLTGNAAKNTSDEIALGNAGHISLSSGTSILEVKVYGGIGEMETRLIEGSIANSVIGRFSNYEYGGIGQKSQEKEHKKGVFIQDTFVRYYNNYVNFGAVSRSNFEGYISGLTYNQNEVAKMFDKLTNSKGIENLVTGLSIIAIEEEEKGDGAFERTKKAFDKLSGSFILRAIESVADNDIEDRLYNKVREIDAKDEARKLKELWVQVQMDGMKYEGEEAIGTMKAQSFGGYMGLPIYRKNAFISGVYLGYVSRSIEEEKDKAQIGGIEAGLYGGKYFDKKVSIKGNIGLGLSSIDIKRKIDFPEYQEDTKAGFNTFNIKVNAQAQYNISMTNEVDLVPYIGMKNALINNGIINETGGEAALEIRGKSYIKSLWLAGLKIEDEKGNFRWSVRGWGGYTLFGGQSEYEVRLKSSADADYMSIRGLSIGAEIGVGGGIEYRYNEKTAFFVNGNISYGKEEEDYYANAGILYKLGETFKEQIGYTDDSQEETEEEEGYEAQDIKVVRLLAAEFDFGKYDLKKEAIENIKLAAQEIKKYNYTRITIEGDADSIGEEKINKSLSIMRARAVYEELYKNGIPLKNMRYIEFKGSRDPIASNMSEEGRARNRRAEIVIEYPSGNKKIVVKEAKKGIDEEGEEILLIRESIQEPNEEGIIQSEERPTQSVQEEVIKLQAIDLIIEDVEE
ncbi:MAG: OmpA family protein [Elusimicrobiota bacterium]|nr:OmpA family protein [Elusimicrobiota bacterium]